MPMNILAAINKCLILLMIQQSHNEYEGVFLNNKCLRHSKKRIQSKGHRTGTYEIKKIYCPIFLTKYMFKTMDIMD